MEPTEEEKAKAHRATVILYLVMGIFVLAPFLLLWLKRK